jgi:uncharacterized protein (TIGR04255 family)
VNTLLKHLIPHKKDHSISEAIFSVFLSSPIVKPQRFEELLKIGQPLSGIFQNFQFNEGVQFGVSMKPNQNPEISQKKTGQDGFMMEAYSEGKIDWVIRSLQIGNVYTVSIHCLNYSNWEFFYNKVFSFLEILSNFEKGLYVTGYSLNYIDQFNWLNDELPDMKVIFNDTSKYLPHLLFETKGVWTFTSTQNRIVDSQYVLEHTNLATNLVAIGNYNISIVHNAASMFPEVKSLTDLCDEKEALKRFADKMHGLNRDFLLQTLNSEVLALIGLKS